jgi:hypothetical protein
MAKKETTAIVSAELQKSLDIINQSKSQIDEIGKNCMEIKVVDESTLTVAQNNLSKANDMVKFVEEKRKEVKEPHLNNCKIIDETCKTLSESVIKAVEHLKAEIKAYAEKKAEEDRKKQQELERKQEEERRAMEAENKRKADIQKYINETLTPWLKKQHEGASSVELCDKVLATINEKWPGADKFMEFTDYATGVKNTYVDLIKMKRQQLADADNMSDEQKQLIAEKEQIAKDKQLLLEREASIAKKEAEIAAEKARKEAELKAKEEAEKLLKEQEANKMSGTRKIWKFELVDKSKLLPEWISVDGDAVKAYMKDNKDKIKSGDVINGIKFYQDISISS